MFAHVTIGTSDPAAAERFYTTVLATLGIEPTRRDDGLVEWEDFRVVAASDQQPVTRGLHIGFTAPDHARVDAFWRAGVAAGYRDDGAPGPRPEYGPDYYGGFLRDPDDNSAEAVHHDSLRSGGIVDHLWIRVADVAAAKAFYEGIAPSAGLRLSTDIPERAQFKGRSGSFSLVAGEPTENVQLAFAGPGEKATLHDPDGNTVAIGAG
jgi:catechol 2,3-dioxygenase-like lactoylglutathione lyase family enzyme